MPNPKYIPPCDPKLREVVNKHGGWTLLLDENFSRAEAWDELETAGLSREQFNELRRNGRRLILEELSQELYWNWRWLMDGTLKLRKPLKSPFSGDTAWQAFPYEDYWLRDQTQDRMTRFSISKQDIDDCTVIYANWIRQTTRFNDRFAR